MKAKPRLLVVDDEADLRGMLDDYLGVLGFEVVGAQDGETMGKALAAASFDLILLDVNMPGENGFVLLDRLRKANAALPVLMLTAVGATAQKVEGLRRGADDYIVKPFDLRELLARIRALLARAERWQGMPAPPSPPAPVAFGTYCLDLAGRSLRDAAGVEVALTAMEFDLLAVFAQHPRQVIARDRLVELAHGRDARSDARSVDVRVTRLRKKIETEPASPRLIRTVRGEGYLFDPDAV